MKKYIILLSLFTVLGCESPRNIIDNFTLGIASDLMDYTVGIQVFDVADSSKTISNIEIEILGNLQNRIYDVNGRTSIDFFENTTALGLHKSENPIDEQDVKRVGFILKAPGYVDYRSEIDFVFDEFQQSLSIPMLSLDSPPQGVSFSESTYALSGGVTTQPISFTMPTSDSISVGLNIDIPAGIEFISANGDTLSGSDLSLEIGQFDPSNEAATTIFPGGFSQDSVISEDGTPESGEFFTAGFAALDMYVDGQEVKNFSQPILVTIDLADSAFNPTTNALVQVGDSMPVWSYDEVDGTWVYETTGIVSQGVDGLELSYYTTHLSWWNLDFWYNRCCTYCGGVSINMPNDASGWYRMKVKYSNSNSYRKYVNEYLYPGKVIRFYRSAGYNWDFLFETSDGTPIGSTLNKNICSGTIHPVNLNPPVPLNLTLDVEGFCPNDATRSFRPSFYVYYKPISRSYYSYLTYCYQGTASTNRLSDGATYDFKVYFYDYAFGNGWQVHEERRTIDAAQQTAFNFLIDVSPYGLCD